jgi:hypothetical protein
MDSLKINRQLSGTRSPASAHQLRIEFIVWREDEGYRKQVRTQKQRFHPKN